MEDHILGQEQAGLDKVIVGTIYHIFVLQLIVELYQSVHKRVHCAFIDYRKTFDSIIGPFSGINYYPIKLTGNYSMW